MQLIENTCYLAMIDRLIADFPCWEQLNGKTLFISGASGMLGSLLVDAVMVRNRTLPVETQCKVIAIGRNREAAERRFAPWLRFPAFHFMVHDVSEPLVSLPLMPDYWVHAASTTHPLAYSNEPINTILSNVLGIHHLLEAASKHNNSRFLCLSSVEIYGENRGDTEYFREDYCGRIDCNTLRAGYPEAKRVSEAMCQAYIQQRHVDAVVIRLPRCYGPTMRMEDSKAIAQFIKKSVQGENIVLKSAGNQLYSFAYAADAVLGMLWVLLCGETGRAYNLADPKSDITLKALAELAAAHAGTKVVFELPDEAERKGYSTASKALLDGNKLKELGWNARYDIAAGMRETIDILREVSGEGQV